MNISSKHRQRRKGDSTGQTTTTMSTWPTAGRQNEKRAALLAGTERAVAIFNTGGRLVDCNEAYINLCELPSELTRAGTSFESILDHLVEMGNYPGGDPNDYISLHLGLSSKSTEQTRIERLPNGRAHSTGYIPVNGGGWITTLDDISALYTIKEELEHSSFYDRRTALPNQRLLMQCLDDALAKQWQEQSFALIAIDFSALDGVLSQSGNHHLLREVAQRLTKTIRGEDVAAKLDGSRFGILQANITSPSDAEVLVQRLARSLSMPYNVENQTIMPDFHMGIVVAGQSDNSEEVLLSRAMLTAEQARNQGMKRYGFYEEQQKALTA